MEFTLRTIIVMIILVVAFMVFMMIILGWGTEANTWFTDVFGSLKLNFVNK